MMLNKLMLDLPPVFALPLGIIAIPVTAARDLVVAIRYWNEISEEIPEEE